MKRTYDTRFTKRQYYKSINKLSQSFKSEIVLRLQIIEKAYIIVLMENT